jgi:hypothetical protein
MRFLYSLHWKLKKCQLPNITDDILEYAITHSAQLRDKYWSDAQNAICAIPPSGRVLKVVYKRKGDKFKIVTAFWL